MHTSAPSRRRKRSCGVNVTEFDRHLTRAINPRTRIVPTTVEAAAYLGVHQSTISRLRTGSHGAGIEVITAFAARFPRVKLDTVFDLNDSGLAA